MPSLEKVPTPASGERLDSITDVIKGSKLVGDVLSKGRSEWGLNLNQMVSISISVQIVKVIFRTMLWNSIDIFSQNHWDKIVLDCYALICYIHFLTQLTR